jgi:hypothetical protein
MKKKILKSKLCKWIMEIFFEDAHSAKLGGSINLVSKYFYY